MAKKKEAAKGLVNLAGKEGAVIKRALLCRTGSFDGLYGPVTVTQELLQGIADTYNAARAKPQNENDYAPILKDHARAVDLVLGRILANLSVEEWENPETGAKEHGLYGDLRIDDEDAKKYVETGKYSQLSISFDEETYELYEVSFVAVEAARRSQVLAKGEKRMKGNLKALQAKHLALITGVRSLAAIRSAATLAMGENLKATEADVAALSKEITTLGESLRLKALSSQFKTYVREGRLSKAEFEKLPLKDWVALDAKALSAIIGSYASRPVSADVQQFGQQGAQPVKVNMTPEKMREAIKLQQSGKGAALAEGEEGAEDDEAKKKREAEEAAAAAGGESNDSEVKYEDVEEAIKALETLSGSLGKVTETLKRMGSELKKLSESEDEEKKLAAEGEADADEDDEEEK